MTIGPLFDSSKFSKKKFLTIKTKYILKYDIRISTESIVCHTNSINYDIGFLSIIIYFVNI